MNVYTKTYTFHECLLICNMLTQTRNICACETCLVLFKMCLFKGKEIKEMSGFVTCIFKLSFINRPLKFDIFLLTIVWDTFMIVKIGVYRLGTCACEIISWITHIMEVWSIQLREAELCLRLQHPREGTRLVPRAQHEGLV